MSLTDLFKLVITKNVWESTTRFKPTEDKFTQAHIQNAMDSLYYGFKIFLYDAKLPRDPFWESVHSRCKRSGVFVQATKSGKLSFACKEEMKKASIFDLLCLLKRVGNVKAYKKAYNKTDEEVQKCAKLYKELMVTYYMTMIYNWL